MKTILHLTWFLGIVLCNATALHAQTISAGLVGKFGIDGDIWSDVALTGIQANKQGGTHDWFHKSGGTGVGLFDTTGAAAIKKRIMAGENLYFQRSMQFPRYTVQDGDLLMDASYTRDQMGLGGTVLDKTAFYYSSNASGGYAKLGDDPSNWITVPSGNSIPSKTDIVDAYVNMRRNGTTTAGTNPSHIMLHVGATTLANDGDRYVSFIFLKDRISYDSVSGKFNNSGPAVTGGHSPWTFNADSTVKQTGDIAISFNFSSGGVQSIQLLIWCNYTDYSTMAPKKFDFVPGQWYGNNAKSGWGWAAVTRNSGLQVWGATNTANTPGPVWGTNSKSAGIITNNYAADVYYQYQFAEASIDLTSAGLDFALSTDSKCSPPFTRYLVATRSASGFSAPMMDFIGPYEFLDAPTAPATITNPGNISCRNPVLSLSPSSYIRGAYYSWRTADGNITMSNGDSSSVSINKPGTYVLTASIAQGCNTKIDSVLIRSDKFQPVAKASTTGIPFAGATATIFGGDPVASNYATPFGGSQGLTYRWTGPPGFPPSIMQNPTTALLGDYELVVTEARNGCKDTAFISVVDSSTFRIVLAVKFTDFSVNTNREKKVNLLSWKMADVSEVDRFVVEKSADSRVFAPAGYVFAGNATTSYKLSDPADTKTGYYRIKAVTKSGASVYTGIMKVKADGTAGSLSAYNDGSGSVVVNYTAPVQQNVSFAIINFGGQVLKRVEHNVSAGSNVFRIGNRDNISPGVYLLQARSGSEVHTIKINL